MTSSDDSEDSDSLKEVSRYAKLMLEQAGVGDRLPTPIDDVVSVSKLMVSQDIILSEKHSSFFTRQYKLLASALKKAVGLVDLRQRVIYLDTTVVPQRQGFVKLHEVGHETLPWQRQTYLYLDDDDTLDPEVKELYEREANFFAAEMMFQLDRFEKDARDMPLALKSPMALAQQYGASKHAAIRRFVERSSHPCAVLVFELAKPDAAPEDKRLRLKRAVQSRKFTVRFGDAAWPEYPPLAIPFVWPILRGCRLLQDGQMPLADATGKFVECGFHVFNSSYNVFVFIFPQDLKIRARSNVIVVR